MGNCHKWENANWSIHIGLSTIEIFCSCDLQKLVDKIIPFFNINTHVIFYTCDSFSPIFQYIYTYSYNTLTDMLMVTISH